MEATTVDGDVYLEGDFEKLNGNAADGSFYLTVPENANANISANTGIDAGGVAVKETGENKWQLGSGGKYYIFHFGGGSLNLRCATEIESL